MDSTSSADALSSLSSNWVYILVAVLAVVAGYFIYKRYYSVSYAAPVSAPPAVGSAAPEAAKDAEVEEYESDDDKQA
jgi:hypothetical protein